MHLRIERRHTATYAGDVYDVTKLISAATDIEPETVAIDCFIEHLDPEWRCWDDAKGDALSPVTIIGLVVACRYDWLAMMTAWPHLRTHFVKVRDADYEQYPLLVINGDIVDGMHRLTRAILDGVDEIHIKRLPALPTEAIIRSSKTA